MDVTARGATSVGSYRRSVLAALGLLGLCVALAQAAVADVPPLPSQAPGGHAVHLRYSDRTPPGVIAEESLRRGIGPVGYSQWIELRGPEGVSARFLGDGNDEVHTLPARVPLLLGGVYRLEISNFPDRPGVALYPTIEVIDRLYPPAGAEERFPVPVEITAEEIELALQGRMITKVVVLEEPDQALPVASEDGLLPVLAVAAGENPLYRADLMGRPMAILRMGSIAAGESEAAPFGPAPQVRRDGLPRVGRSPGGEHYEPARAPSRPSSVVSRPLLYRDGTYR